MNTNQRKISFAIFFVIVISSCIKKESKNDIEKSLKTTMEIYLNHQTRIDTSRVKFKVIEVSYFPAKLGYICQFKVNMKQKLEESVLDTTGMMSANISKDFKNVLRRE